MSKLERIARWMVVALAFAIPIEHKYDKFLRFFSLKIIPNGLFIPPGYDLKIYVYASDVLALTLVSLALCAFKVPLRRFFFDQGAAFLWILFGCAIFSLILSPFSGYLTPYTRLVQLFTPIALYSFLVNKKVEVKPIFYALALAGTFQALFAIGQYALQEPLGLRLLSETRDPPSTFYMENAKLWLFGQPCSSSIIRRASGTLPHSNILGGFLLVSILSTYSLIATHKKKVALSIALVLQFLALSLSFSRSAIFGVILATILWFSWGFFQGRSYRFLACAVAFSGIFSTSLLYEQFHSRGGIVNYNETAQNADRERLNAQNTAFNMIKKNPKAGVGFGQFTRESSEKEKTTIPAHNIYLFVLSEMGIVAFASLLGFCLFVLIQAFKSPFSPELGTLTAAFIALAFVGGCDFYPITSQQGKLMFFLVAALLVSKAKESHAKLANV